MVHSLCMDGMGHEFCEKVLGSVSDERKLHGGMKDMARRVVAIEEQIEKARLEVAQAK